MRQKYKPAERNGLGIGEKMMCEEMCEDDV